MALLTIGTAHAGSAAGTTSASTHVRIEVVIAPVVQVLQNRFPEVAGATTQGRLKASQRLVVSTNMRHGFCLNLHADGQSPGGWRVRSAGDHMVQVDAMDKGWRVCGHGKGLHTFQLEHEFDEPVERSWHVHTELTLL